MQLRRNILHSASLLAIALMAAPAVAQQPAVDPQGTETPPEGEIIVTGIRQSIRASIDAKRTSGVISEVITAEDIGKFPDKNVAEALQRLPGIVINREFGEGERVALRGTAPNLTKTLVNGHAIATADWFVLEQLAATRSFNFLTLPSEIVGQLEVYKSPQADVEEGGIGGTINVNTRNPLDLDRLTISGSAQMVYSELRDKVNPQASGLVSWHNNDATFGIIAGAVYQKRDTRRDNSGVIGYFNGAGDPAGDALIPSLIGSALFVQERERYGGNIGIQIRPSDSFEVNITGLYSMFGADNFNENFLAWPSNAIGGGGKLTNFTVKDGTVVSGRIDSTPGGRAVVYDAIDRDAKAETGSVDFDLKWRPSDNGSLHVKVGYTEAHGDTTSQPFYEGGAPGGFTFDLTEKAPQVTFFGIDPTDPNDLDFDFASLHQVTNTDKEKYLYLDYEHEIDLGIVKSIKFGGKFTDHDRITRFPATTYGGFFLPLLATGCNGGPCTSADFASGELTPANYLKRTAAPGTLRSYWQVDRKKLEDILNGLPASVRARVPNPPENYSINEKAYGGYAMAKFEGQGWRGNAGLRVVRTEQVSKGNRIGLPAGPGTINDNPFGIYQPITVKRAYTDVLPSVNLSVDLTEHLLLRVAAGRTVARPDYTDIVPRTSLNGGALTASGGNPLVDPYRANQYDVSLEYYPDRDTIFAVAFFYRDINSYISDSISQAIYPVQTNTPNISRCTVADAANNLYNCLFDQNIRSNGPGGTNKGIELQATRSIWGGFGVTGNYTYSDADTDDGSPVRENSKHSLNVSGFFENDLLSFRLSYNYRSKFYYGIDRAIALNQASTDSVDASLSVNVTKNIALTANAINLTNSKIFQYSGTTTRPLNYYDNGRQFYVGGRFLF